MPICGCRWCGDVGSGTLQAPAIRDIQCNHWANYTRIRPFGIQSLPHVKRYGRLRYVYMLHNAGVWRSAPRESGGVFLRGGCA